MFRLVTTMLCSNFVVCLLWTLDPVYFFVWCARVRNSLSASTFSSNYFLRVVHFIVAFIWCTLVRFMSCVDVPVFIIRLDIAFGFVCLALSARVRNSLSARTFCRTVFYGSSIFIAAFIWCTLARLWVAFTFLFLLSDSILRCVYFALVSFVLVYRYGCVSCLTFVFLCCLVLSMS